MGLEAVAIALFSGGARFVALLCAILGRGTSCLIIVGVNHLGRWVASWSVFVVCWVRFMFYGFIRPFLKVVRPFFKGVRLFLGEARHLSVVDCPG